MERKIASELLSIGAVFLRPEEPFTWASGIKSPIYCDNRLTLSAPAVRDSVEHGLAELVKKYYPGCQMLMGTSTAGIAHAAITATILGLPMGYVRSEAKSHGRNNRIEGRMDKGTKVVVVEDLISTAGSALDVVQALNVVTLLGTDVEHEIVDGGLWQDEVAALGIQGVPSVFADGELLHVGRGDLGVLLDELEAKYGSEGAGQAEPVERRFDVVVVGGGPAGASAAIYSARKGLSVAVVAGRIGGQVNDTVGIENLISVPATTGASLAAALQEHIGAYPIEVFANRSVEGADFIQPLKSVKAKGGETFVAPAVIIATGASWRRLGVEGESEYIGRGVAFCPHCDGPFYKGRHVAVIGGGNSGIEAAIDLAGICSRVTVLEFAAELRADTVLQDKARSLGNVEILTSRQTVRVVGDGKKVTAIDVRDLNTGEVSTLPLDGVFVQIGLVPASGPFAGLVDINRRGEIVTDGAGRSSVPGVYAAGDVADVPFKQIVIAMGDGATAALSAFDDRVRGVLGS